MYYDCLCITAYGFMISSISLWTLTCYELVFLTQLFLALPRLLLPQFHVCLCLSMFLSDERNLLANFSFASPHNLESCLTSTYITEKRPDFMIAYLYRLQLKG